MQPAVTLMSFMLVLLASSLALGSEPTAQPRQIAIRVEPGDWGAARMQEIEKVLESVASVLLPHFPQRAAQRISAGYSGQGPMACGSALPGA